MADPAAVVVCALALLGRTASSMPPVELVSVPPPEVSANADAFVRRGVPIIHLVTSASAFRDARCGDRSSLLKLASILVHEEWHVKNGSDERGAYSAQLLALMHLGAGPGHRVYQGVYRSMRTVLKAEEAAARAP